MSENGGDGCEWNPTEERASWSGDVHFDATPAAVIVGADGQWRLCESCAALPHFARFKSRKPITPPPPREAAT